MSLLAAHSASRSALLRHASLSVRLAALTEADHADVARQAKAALNALHAHANTRVEAPRARASLAPVSASRPLSESNSQARTAAYLATVTLQARRESDVSAEMSAADRSTLEHRLIAVTGVVSVSVSRAGLVALHCKASAEVADIEAQCTNLAKPEFTVIKAGTNTGAASTSQLPLTADKENISWSSSRAIVCSASLEHSSLQSRFQSRAKKTIETQHKQNKAKGLFSSVTAYFW